MYSQHKIMKILFIKNNIKLIINLFKSSIYFPYKIYLKYIYPFTYLRNILFMDF